MSGVAKWQRPEVGTRTASVSGSGASWTPVGGGDWTGTVLELEDHAVDIPDLGGPVIASSLVAMRGVVRSGGAVYRLRRGWRAQQGGVGVIDFRQPLAPRPNGSFTPAGPWGPGEWTTYRAVGTPTRRVGDIQESGQEASSEPATATAGGPLHLHDSAAMEQLRYLPVSVQRSMQSGVPHHSVFVAQALQYTRGDGSVYHRVCGLRLSDQEAVVVSAARQQHTPTWQVELVRYTFSVDRTALPDQDAAERRRLS